MPSDIRSFFGGGAAAKSAPKPVDTKKDIKAPKNEKSRGRPRKIVSDDDDDELVEVKPNKSSTPKIKKTMREPVEEETTSSAYFASSKAKPTNTKATPTRSKSTNVSSGINKTPTKQPNGATPSTGRRSARKAGRKNYAEEDDRDTPVLEEDKEGHDDIFNDMKSRKVDDDYEEGSDEEEIQPPTRATQNINGKSKRHLADEDEHDLDVAEIATHDSRKSHVHATTPSSRKRKSKELEADDDFLDDDDDVPKKKIRNAPAQTSRKSRAPAKKEDRPESENIQNILDNIPTVRAPTPPPREEGAKTWKFGGGNANVAPPAQGTAQIPVGAPNCLAGLNFVFTGVLNTLGREEGQSLVKQYGGKVTGAPSKKTSFVVLGADAGPKKLETIKSLGIKTIDETGLFAIISSLPANGGDGKAAEAYAEKQAKEDAKIREQAEEMAARERQKLKEAERAAQAAAARNGAPAPAKPKPKGDDRLWVDKYAPDSMSSVCGNKNMVEGLQAWLRAWPKSAKSGFRMAGATGKGIFRAAMLHGPPGVGKTTAAHLVAKLEGYDVVESNASETRNKKLLETGLRGVLDTTSLLGYFAGDGKKIDPSKRKLLLVMDEVDGMSAGDRGGVGALAAVAKKTNVPIIMICNDRRLPKMKPFDGCVADFPFRRPTTDMIRGRIATICYREGFKLPMPVINALIEGCNGDIRQIINMVSTIKLDKKDKELDFDDTKAMSKAWEKHVILKPWDIVSKILRPQMFAGSSSASLNDKTELYFNDHEFSYLMLQENYLKTQPSLANGYSGKEREMKLLELFDNAASSISDGDLVDRMIHGSQQQWSLMPTHAIFSFVRPASYIYGNFNTQVGFTSWLGNNSKLGKLSRLVKEIQGHMRLRASADRHEVRQQYLPAIWNKTVNILQNEGKDSAQDVIDFMDSYYLTRDDYDAVLELGVGRMNQEAVKIDTATKAAFTRLYNSQSHPMPFVKAGTTLGSSKGAAPKRDKPDLEEAVDESEAEEVVDEAVEDSGDEIDLKKDKYIKAPKKKPAPKGKGQGKDKRKKGDEIEMDENAEESEDQPKKKKVAGGGAKGGRKGKGRG